MEGKVKWFNYQKNYGFITPDDGSKDVFVHGTSIESKDRLAENDKVTFEIQQSDKGPQAVKVKKSGSGAVADVKKKEMQKEGEIKADKEILKEVKEELAEDKAELESLKKDEKKAAKKKTPKKKE